MSIVGLSHWECSRLISVHTNGELIVWNTNMKRKLKKQENDLYSIETILGNTKKNIVFNKNITNFESFDQNQTENDIIHTSIYAHSGCIYDFQHFEDFVATTSANEIKLWRMVNEPSIQVIPIAELNTHCLKKKYGIFNEISHINSIALIDKQATKIAAVIGDSNAYILDVEQQCILHSFKGHLDYIHAIKFIDCGNSGIFFTGSEDGTCKFWDQRQVNSCVATFPIDKQEKNYSSIKSINVSKDKNWLAFGGSINHQGFFSTIHVPSRTMFSHNIWNQGKGSVQAIEFIDSKIVIGGTQQNIECWNFHTNTFINNIVTSSPSIYALHFSPEQNILSVGGRSPLIDLFTPDYTHICSLCA